MFDERAFVFCTLKIGISYKVKQSPPPVKRVVRDAGYKPALPASV